MDTRTNSRRQAPPGIWWLLLGLAGLGLALVIGGVYI